MTPAMPAFSAGELLLLETGVNSISVSPPAIAGWTMISPGFNILGAALYARIAVGGDTSPTFQWDASHQAFARILSFNGDVYTDLATIVSVANDRAGNATGRIIVGATAAPAQNNCLVIRGGRCVKTATNNGSAFGDWGDSGIYTKAGNTQLVQNGAALAAGLWYWIQTNAAGTNVDSAPLTNTDTSANSQGYTVVLRSAVPAGMGYGVISKPGNPALSSPTNHLQFGRLPSIASQPQTIVPIQGIALSTSVAYGTVINSIVNVGYVPQPGPGISPFNNNQFLESINSTGNPSPGTLSLAGIASSGTAVYINPSAQVAQAGGLAVTSSTAYGQIDAVLAGALVGIAVSSSVAYAESVGTGELAGVAASNSTATILGIGGSFQPLVPMTAVVDVRLGIGYQPWTVHPSGTSG